MVRGQGGVCTCGKYRLFLRNTSHHRSMKESDSRLDGVKVELRCSDVRELLTTICASSRVALSCADMQGGITLFSTSRTDLCHSESTIRMDQHLCVPFHSLVKLVIGHFCIVDANLVTDHKAGLRLSGDDEVSQVSVVLLDVALTSSQRETLLIVSAWSNPIL